MFYLSDDTSFHVETEVWARTSHPGGFWQTNVHTVPPRLGIAILAGSRIIFEPVFVDVQDTAFITVGTALEQISEDGLDVIVRFRMPDSEVELARKFLPKFDPASPWEELELDLDPCRGRSGSVVIECGAGPSGNPCADWASIYEMVIGPPDKRTLLRARAFQAWRTRNKAEPLISAGSSCTPAPRPTLLGWLRRSNQRSTSLSPHSAQRYAGDLLQKAMGHPIPDFTSRLRKRISALPGNQKLQMLALCCGTAEKERVLLERVKSNRIELTLVELNEEVLSHVSKKLEPYCTVSLVAADANRLELPQEHYDLIFCAAGLHHLVELEHVVDTISAALRKGGEFWSVGEYIGCSGARLWPEAYDIANPFFSGLPEKYRLSAYTKNVDKVLPNADASVSTYEGIRAPEIEHILAARLRPIHVTKQACFLWRFFDGAYGLNYDLNNSADLDVIRRAVAIDVKHQAEGGRPTSLNGIYSKR